MAYEACNIRRDMLEDICMSSYNKKHSKRHSKIDELVKDITSAFPKVFPEIEKFLRDNPDTFVLSNNVYFNVVIGTKPEHVVDNTTLDLRTIKTGNDYYFKILVKSKLYCYLNGYYFEAINARNRLMKAFAEELQMHTSKKIELASGDYTYEFSYCFKVRESEK